MNAIGLISPYKHNGMWVFNDANVGLCKEPFVAGIDTIIDRLVKDIPNASKGFNLLFAATPFPTYDIKLTWLHEEHGGNWYYCSVYDMQGWLCPALFKYFSEAPKTLYGKAMVKE